MECNSASGMPGQFNDRPAFATASSTDTVATKYGTFDLNPACGLSGSGGPPRMDQVVPRRYSLNFTAMARNVFNAVNLAQPVGVLQSPLFGKSNALAGVFFSSAASNRS